MSPQPKPMTLDEFHVIFEQVKNWGRWGADDQHGTLNLITPEKRRQAASLVQEGVTVSAALPLATEPGPWNHAPVVHLMVQAGDMEEAHSSSDYFAIAPHGLFHTHLDALCHYFYRREMYNGRPASMATSRGATVNSIETAQDGIVSRGVLLDIPRLKGIEWLEPREAIYPADLEAAEEAANVRVEEGDILLVRTGRHRRLEHVKDWGLMDGLAGLDVSCGPWLHQRGVAVLGSDGVSDVFPSPLESGRLPVHLLALPAMGMLLVDNCQFEPLGDACAQRERWEFLLTIAPLKLLRGTASPVNPIAVF